jgi:archaeosine synthase
LTEAVSSYQKLNDKRQKMEALTAFARFQFGEPGEDLLSNTEIKGRYPNLRIFKGKEQIGMLVGERGMISLTLKGAEILAKSHSYWVNIDDFTPKGSIFAVGVLDADSEIRIGDDVVVLRDGELMGVGVAQMSPREMIESKRGEAVRIRHLVKSR